ncbi:MDR family MFS transporter [Paeniglutamicibacter sp. NPDC012692]|uniref:MDR family MFS transporter n=1 Tax=Paeniglutamicibacter sp. NPDC012692 TaxID=3364388 RepID=UPI0036C10ADE
MSHRQVMQSLTGLLMGMFVSILAGTVVASSLPIIVSDLGGSQTSYTWVVTATLLATTISTPIWGKLADLVDRKLLLQLSLAIFVIASAIAGFSQDTNMLITMRVLQGLGGGGMAALSQVVMADIISPRERGKYMGLFGAIMAVGTVAGPLIGGFITDSINWRWNFFVALPIAVVAIWLIQRTLHLPELAKRKVKIDYFGIILLSAGVSLLLIWVSMAGTNFEWASPTTAWMVGGAVLALIAFVVVEIRASEPLINLGLFKNATFTLAVIASLSVGVTMFGTSVFLSQYMIMARGATATSAGLMTLPMMAGVLIVSTIAGAMISRFGKWKAFVVAGSVMQTIGLFALGTIHYDTNFLLLSAYMFLLGSGVGMVMQNMVLVVQNAVPQKELGVASSAVTFFRSLGGTIGVAALGSILALRIPEMLAERKEEMGAALAHLGAAGNDVGQALASGTMPAMNQLPESIRQIIESVYGDAVAHVFAIAAPLGFLTILAVAFLPNLPLSRMTRTERSKVEEASATADTEAGELPSAAGTGAVVANTTDSTLDADKLESAPGR